MSEFIPVNVVWRNGATYVCRSEEQLASFLEDGWKVVEPKKPARKRATRKSEADNA